MKRVGAAIGYTASADYDAGQIRVEFPNSISLPATPLSLALKLSPEDAVREKLVIRSARHCR